MVSNRCRKETVYFNFFLWCTKMHPQSIGSSSNCSNYLETCLCCFDPYVMCFRENLIPLRSVCLFCNYSWKKKKLCSVSTCAFCPCQFNLTHPSRLTLFHLLCLCVCLGARIYACEKLKSSNKCIHSKDKSSRALQSHDEGMFFLLWGFKSRADEFTSESGSWVKTSALWGRNFGTSSFRVSMRNY